MKYKIEQKKAESFFDVVEELEKLFDERISELHKVTGMQQARHAYIFYRKLLWEAKGIMNDNLKGKKI